MAADNELIIHASLRDELTAPLARVRAEVDATAKSAGRASTATAGTSTALTRMETASKRLHATMGELDTRLKSLSSRFTNFVESGVKRGITSFGLLTTAVVGFGLKAASSFQQSQVAFETLLGSADKGKALFQQVSDFKFKTPFSIAELSDTTQQLVHFGVSADQALSVLKGISDVAATSADPSGSLSKLTLAFGQIMSEGIVTPQAVRQLTQAGLDPFASFANQLGISQAEVRKKLTAGKLDSSLLVQALATEGPGFERYAGGAQRAATQTLSGMWSNLKATLQRGLADAAQPLMAQLSGMMPVVTAGLSAFLKSFGPSAFKLVGDLVNLLMKGLPILEPIVTAIADGMSQLLVAAGPAVTALQPLGGEVGQAFSRFFTALVPLMPKLIVLFGKLVELLPKILDDLIKLMPLFSGVIDFMTGVLSNSTATDVIAGLLTGLLAYKKLSGVIGVLTSFAKALGLIGDAQAGVAASSGAGGAGSLLALAGRAAPAAGLAYGAYDFGNTAAQGGFTANNIARHVGRGAVDLAFLGAPEILNAGITGIGNLFGADVGLKSLPGIGAFWGDVPSSAVMGNMGRVDALAAAAGGGIVTSRLRTVGTRGPDSGHRSGTALDIVPRDPGLYAQRVRALGGFAAREGAHFHTELMGDAPMPRSAGAGGGDTYTLSFAGATFHGQVDYEAGLENVLTRIEKKRRERSYRGQG